MKSISRFIKINNLITDIIFVKCSSEKNNYYAFLFKIAICFSVGLHIFTISFHTCSINKAFIGYILIRML